MVQSELSSGYRAGQAECGGGGGDLQIGEGFWAPCQTGDREDG